jgi:phosphate butyryltransferase
MAKKTEPATPKGSKPAKPPTPARPLITSFEGVLEAIREFPLRRVAVACAQDAAALAAVAEARQRNIAEYVLIGERTGILATAEAAGVAIDETKILDERDPLKAAAQAVRLAHDGNADIVMKGYIHTDDFLRAVLDRENGLRSGAIMSHVFILEAKILGKLVIVTDAAMNIAPDLPTKGDIILNAVHLASMLGLETPRVAVLAALELINPAMPATIEAAALAKMAERWQFSVPCRVDGPLALDNALSLLAAKHKKIGGEVAGQADILVVPDIEAGNILAKSFVYLAGGDVAGVLVGAKRPVVLPSRSDNARSKLCSIAVAVLMTNFEREVRLKIGKVHF